MNFHEEEVIQAPLNGPEGCYDTSTLPEEHCLYCHNHNVMTIALCECGKWFCNSAGIGQTGSHIVMHLMRTSHTVIENHEGNNSNVGKYQCAECRDGNAFNLEILSDGSLLCRKCCSRVRQRREDSNIKQLIEGNRVNSCKIHVPSVEEDRKAVKIKKGQIKIIESNIAKGINPLDGLENVPEIAPPLPKIKKIYQNNREYYDIFVNLLRQDMNHMKKALALIAIKDLEITIEKDIGRFEYDALKDSTIKLRKGILIEIEIEKKTFDALVTDLDNTGNKLQVKIYKIHDFPSGTYTFSLKFKFIEVPYTRLLDGLLSFQNGDLCESLNAILLGTLPEYPVPGSASLADLSAPNLPTLNESQVECINLALTSKFTLVQGPPGTGKTHLAATLVYNLAKTLDKLQDKILICASSNVAVDNIVARIHSTGVNVVKIASRTREKIRSEVDSLCLHTLVRNYIGKNYPGNVSTYEMKQDFDEWLSTERMEIFRKIVGEAQKEILDQAKVICCTCITSFDDRLGLYCYKYVILDEANQIPEVESLLPLLRGCKKAVLVGDHMQLGPFTACQATATAGISRSLFSRLVHLGMQPVILNTQYRMHKAISEFPRKFFYEERVQDGISENGRIDNAHSLWPNRVPVVFLHHKDGEGRSIGKSFLNPNEAYIVKDTIEKIMKEGVSIDRIDILTPYLGQKQYLLTINPDYRVHTVDEFQGSERDFIIFSSVRSNDDNTIGFLNDYRRLNVAITRAKYGMIVIGDAQLLAHSKLWGHLMKFYSDNGFIYQGELGQLVPVQIESPVLQPYDFKQDFPYADS